VAQFEREGGGWTTDPGGERRDLGQPGVRPGGLHLGVGRSLEHERAGPHPTTLLDRLGSALTGECRVVDEEAVGGEHDGVGGDPVTGLEDHEVPDDHLGGIDHRGGTPPTNGDTLGQERDEALCRTLRPFLLHEGEDAVERDHGDDGDGDLRQSGDHRQHRGEPQHEGEEVHELCAEHGPPPRPSQRRQTVRPVDGEPLRCRHRREPNIRRLVHLPRVCLRPPDANGSNVPTTPPSSVGRRRTAGPPPSPARATAPAGTAAPAPRVQG
jgi:hypothetical protein